MNKLITQLYQEYNPGAPIRSPRARHLVKPDHKNYGLRWFDKKRHRDIKSLVKIDRQQILLEKMFPKTPSSKKYFQDVFNSPLRHHHDHFYVFAITNLNHQIIGWIQYMVDDYRKNLRQILNLSQRALILEVSYAKLFGPGLKGVAVSGLKQSIDIIRHLDNNNSRTIYISAYTEPHNIASEKVLDKNGFIKLEQQIVYINELSNIWIKKIN